ncbi:site-specific integrase [Bacillus pseudomycoides]|uniref:site-specific integrase n=1 Tax=Bacillus pseudomycoides TaxID=64104 RepID=UPI000BFE1117|nr:site-specific integrase [Bacillus pseudomycoides]PGS03258.1 site-specific integrase [Bacillus pseudomycoides]
MKGSLEKHGTNWRMRVTVGYNEKGNPIRRSRMAVAKNKREAEKELALFIAEIEAGEYIKPQKMVFKDFGEEWKKKYAINNLSPQTYETYCSHLKLRILPALGNMKLEDIKPMHLITLADQLKNDTRKDGKEGTLSPATINYVIRVIKNIFKRAHEWQLIRRNPAEKLTKLKDEYQIKEPYDLEETRQIMSFLEREETMYQILFQLAIMTGFRRGELLGLEWKDINLEDGTVTVRQAVSYANSQYHIKEPKTRTSKRTISIPASLIEKLKRYKNDCNEKRLSCGDLWEAGEYFFVFSSWHGKPLYPSHITKKWHKFTKKHELRHVNFHGLRHTSATLLLEAGENMKVISSRLGHSRINTTIDIYTHSLQSADRGASSKLESLITSRTQTKVN